MHPTRLRSSNRGLRVGVALDRVDNAAPSLALLMGLQERSHFVGSGMWYFSKKRRNDKVRNPIQGEFFATEAIEGPAQALVRESIQNSLDASAGSGAVRVRIALAVDECALPAKELRELLEGAWPHYAASDNGLRDAPGPNSPCPYLVVEDFGTRGLTGDPLQSDPEPGSVNPYFLFFRAEGLSAKAESELGRWGVGKFVFPRSSQASTHFGVTVRYDDQRRLLLGAITLKAHRIDEATYTPDGLYGRLDGQDFVVPIEDAGEIDRFCALFHVTRTTEPGLSVVVPFVDPEITFQRLLVAAVRDYFLPVLHGRLTISIETGGDHVSLDAQSLGSIISTYAGVLGPAVQSQVALARWASGVTDAERFVLLAPDDARAARWSDTLVPETVLVDLARRLESRKPVAVRVPVTVRSKKDGAKQSFFDVYLAPDKASDGRPLFVREGIIVSDVRGARAREMQSLVVIEDRPLAALLGDSENPAHTQWQKDGSNFRGRYTYGPSMIDFVTRSVGELLAIITRRSEEQDPSLTIDFFSIPPDEKGDDGVDADKRKEQQEDGGNTPKPVVEQGQQPTRIEIRHGTDGFTVNPGTSCHPTPFLVELRCAYDIRSGDALKRWHPADFEIGTSQVPVACEGAVVLKEARGNWLLLHVKEPEFRVSVTGFDPDRDIYIRADVREPSNADSQN